MTEYEGIYCGNPSHTYLPRVVLIAGVHTIGIANLEEQLCAEVIWKIVALPASGSIIASWLLEEGDKLIFPC